MVGKVIIKRVGGYDPMAKSSMGSLDECQYCVFFLNNIMSKDRCVIHGPRDQILPKGWCEYFLRGPQYHLVGIPQGFLTKKQSGYVDDAKASMEKSKEKKK